MSTTINKDDPAQVVATAAAVACIVCDADIGWSCRSWIGLVERSRAATRRAVSTLDMKSAAPHPAEPALSAEGGPSTHVQPIAVMPHHRPVLANWLLALVPDGELDHPSSVQAETSMAANFTRSDIVCHFTTLLPKIVTYPPLDGRGSALTP